MVIYYDSILVHIATMVFYFTTYLNIVTPPNYQLVRNREKRNIVPPRRNDYDDLVCYALNMGEGLQDSEPNTFKETFESKGSKKMVKDSE